MGSAKVTHIKVQNAVAVPAPNTYGSDYNDKHFLLLITCLFKFEDFEHLSSGSEKKIYSNSS